MKFYKNQHWRKNTDFINWAKWRLQVFTDCELAEKLGTTAPTISKIRRGRATVGDQLLLLVLEATNTNLKDIDFVIESTRNHWT